MFSVTYLTVDSVKRYFTVSINFAHLYTSLTKINSYEPLHASFLPVRVFLSHHRPSVPFTIYIQLVLSLWSFHSLPVCFKIVSCYLD
jgi:hypothetical protein